MEAYHFRICDVDLGLYADRSLKIKEDMTHFCREAAAPGLSVDCLAAERVQTPDSTLRLREAERLIFQKGSAVSRCRTMRLGEPPYARLDYDLSVPDHARLSVRPEDWWWATDHLRLWSVLSLPQLLLPFRTLIFHASYIGYHGEGILFTAPSGTGKSTQAELWRVHRGAEVINGDKAGVRLEERPMVHGVPFSGTSGICENVSLPLRAIVVLSQAPENTVRRLRPSEAVAALCGNVFVDQAVPEEWQTARNLLLDLAAAVPVYALACTPDVRAVEELERAMAQG